MPIPISRRSFLQSAGAASGLYAATALTGSTSKAGNSNTFARRLKPTKKVSGDDKYREYLNIPTPGGGTFQLAIRRETKGQKAIVPAYEKTDKAAGKLFSPRQSGIVAVVDASEYGIPGDIEVHSKGDSYSVTYNQSPLIKIPSHTEINTRFLFSIDKELKSLPPGVKKALDQNDVSVMLAKSVEDSYYWLYPSWKISDQKIPLDPKVPWIEKVSKNKWKDNRRTSNYPGLYMSSRKQIIIPQKHYKYGSDTELIDRVAKDTWNRNTVYHEVGHAIDDLVTNGWFSNVTDFERAYERDLTLIPEAEKEEIGYFLKNKREPFAEITAALLGGLDKRRSERILKRFPTSSRHIMERVLPLYKYKITPKFVKENIYEGYLASTKEARPALEGAKLASMQREDEFIYGSVV